MNIIYWKYLPGIDFAILVLVLIAGTVCTERLPNGTMDTIGVHIQTHKTN